MQVIFFPSSPLMLVLPVCFEGVFAACLFDVVSWLSIDDSVADGFVYIYIFYNVFVAWSYKKLVWLTTSWERKIPLLDLWCPSWSDSRRESLQSRTPSVERYNNIITWKTQPSRHLSYLVSVVGDGDDDVWVLSKKKNIFFLRIFALQRLWTTFLILLPEVTLSEKICKMPVKINQEVMKSRLQTSKRNKTNKRLIRE